MYNSVTCGMNEMCYGGNDELHWAMKSVILHMQP